MRSALVNQQGIPAGHLREEESGDWSFHYLKNYNGPAISLTLPVQSEAYHFDHFPTVFEGLLPEGLQLEAVLRQHKIDRNDYFQLLVTVGGDLVGALTITEEKEGESN